MADIDGASPVSIPKHAGGPPSRTALVLAAFAFVVMLAAIGLLSREGETKPAAPETAVWPWETSSLRFQAPVDAARSFATDFLGFTSPVIGPFAQGDGRSGEVEVRPRGNGPVSTVFVRQGEDDSWWVIGAANEDIVLEEPQVLDEIRSPVRLQGKALAFEGTVRVHVREDGRREPIGEGFVTGGGDIPSPFDATIEFSTPSARAGAIVLFTESAENGQVWQATVVRVRFASTNR
jgi:hypothetical protein